MLINVARFSLHDHIAAKAKYRIWDPHSATSKLAIKFKDVAGLHQAKVEINEFTEYLSNPGKYTVSSDWRSRAI